MTRKSSSNPSPFSFEGGAVGVLLVHGFTGAPAEMRLVGEYLSQHELTISAPLLPGHGTSIEDLNQRNWQEWTDCVALEAADLKKRCERVFIAGLSLGSLLTLYTAAKVPGITGIIVYSPAVKVKDRRLNFVLFAKYLVKQIPKQEHDFTDPEAATRLWEYENYAVPAAHELQKITKEVKRSLPEVRCPCLIIHSTGDQSIHSKSAQYVYDHIGSNDKEMITLHNSGHVLTLDSEWERVADDSFRFIQRLAPISAGTA